jgi:hypothetical protein
MSDTVDEFIQKANDTQIGRYQSVEKGSTTRRSNFEKEKVEMVHILIKN